mgnify:CR=1 FL=1
MLTWENIHAAAHRAVEAMRGDAEVAALLDDPCRARAAHELRASVADAIARAVSQ